MSYIKKLVMHGFKSFPRKTELPFTPGINVVLGPNGSGKSNITDALCFVLGRLSIKSMRAAKASNLIFLGTKGASPSKEASVEIVLNNTENVFAKDEEEISVKRIVRRNGQSIYKINGETKTRQEVLALLAQAGIDPNGFNIVLQGEIQNFVKMQADDRRGVIEEVSGISIYEARKEKSLRELGKTENKLKEVGTILKERTSYLNNLEKEREAALKHQKLKEDVKKFKKSILNVEFKKKSQSKDEVNKELTKIVSEIEKVKKEIIEKEQKISNLKEEINEINSKIQKETGLEQEKLNQEIANLRADIAGLVVKQENFEKKIKEIEKKENTLKKEIEEGEIEIYDLQKDSPNKQTSKKEVDKKREELLKLEEERKRHYMTRSELKSVKERIDDKKSLLESYKHESDFLTKQIDNLSIELFDKKTTQENLNSLKTGLAHKNELLSSLDLKEKEIEKVINTNESMIAQEKKIIEKIEKLDICPLCKSKVTEKHIEEIHSEKLPEIKKMEEEIEMKEKELNDLYQKRDLLKEEIESMRIEIQKRNSDIIKLKSIEEKENQLKSLKEKIDSVIVNLRELKKRNDFLEKSFDDNSDLEERYETIKIEVEEISVRNKENLSSEISFKEREIERKKISVKQLRVEKEDFLENLGRTKEIVTEKKEILAKKRSDEENLVRAAKKLISSREDIQADIRSFEIELTKDRAKVQSLEDKKNNYKIDIARIDAEIENLKNEMEEFGDVEIIKTKRETLIERLRRAEDTLIRLGNVNMRALEVYNEVKGEYDTIYEKVEIIKTEKEEIMKIINEIDVKKKKVFMRTLVELNEIFTRNFSQLSSKGEVFLELQNKKEPFEAGVDVIVKTGHGKYFDIKSLSGGEQSLVALALIFAIQELRPYAFYILDEIDAALDKRNSERLAGLLKKYMQKGQYIIITHNDEVITRATNLFGVSMHEGISKIISLKV